MPRIRTHRFLLKLPGAPVLIFFFWLMGICFSQAGTDVWVGSGVAADWGTGGNCLAGTPPVNNDSLVFGLSGQQNNTNTLNNLTVGFVAFTNGGFALGGNSLTLNPSTAGIFTNATGTNTINASL